MHTMPNTFREVKLYTFTSTPIDSVNKKVYYQISKNERVATCQVAKRASPC